MAQQNVLQNPGFETNPPTQNGNNIGYPITPWVLGTGNQSNVVHVDGPGGVNYNTDAPQFDASNSPAGTWRNYLDIANGSNDFYQSFVPSCTGEVRFGGYFSTRDDSTGHGSVTIREGSGLTGTVVAQHAIDVPVQRSSRDDAWTRLEYTAQITAGTTYSFIVRMNNDMNFDEGFVSYNTHCFTDGFPHDMGEMLPLDPIISINRPQIPDTCCPPMDKSTLLSMLSAHPTGGLSDPYSIGFTPDATWGNQWQAYVNYLHALNPAVTGINMMISTETAGNGNTPTPNGGSSGGLVNVSWTAGGSGPSVSGAIGNINTNEWYLFNAEWFSIMNGHPGPSADCPIDPVAYRIQVQARRSDNPNVVFQTIDEENRVRNIERMNRRAN